ncbi:hypothetical protein [Brevundimonas sp. CEF1]|uniref:hypothetical protein n=1 Tax=Brevundimonas sp. CEF1 TaxID=3442642 RepID=UPI003F511A46
MNKNFLLVAASAAALAFAGTAVSADLSNVTLATVGVTETAPYAIANVATGTLRGDVTLGVEYDSPIPSGNNILVTVKLTNAVFGEAFTISDIDLLDGAGVPIVGQQRTISDGGAVGDNFVTFLASGTASDLVHSIDFNDKLIEFTAGAVPTIAVETKTEFGTPIEGGSANFGAAKAATLVKYDDLVSVDVTAGEKAILALSDTNIFSQFDTSKSPVGTTSTVATLGNIDVNLNDVYLPSLQSPGLYNLTTTEVDEGDVSSIAFTYTGVNGGSTGITLAPAGPILTAGLSPANDIYTANVTATLSGSVAKANSDYTVNVRVNFVDYPTFQSGAKPLASIRRDGVTAEVPWVASATLANNNLTKSTIRVANKGGEAAAVYAEYVTSANRPAGTSTVVGRGVPVEIGSVAAGSDLQITSSALTTALGEFGRGNIVVTVEANADDITVNNRIVYADGRVEETPVILID